MKVGGTSRPLFLYMPLQQQFDPVISLPLPPKKKASDYLKAYESWVYTAITSISHEVASINLSLFQRRIKNGKPDTSQVHEHEALSLLFHVNDFYTQYDLLEGTQIYLDLVGEAFWAILRSGSKPAELWLMRPDWVEIVPDKAEFIKSYKYYPGGVMVGNRGVIFDRKDVIHFKYFSPTNPYRGFGAVQAGAMAIDTDKFSAEWNRNFFFNSAIPGTILTTTSKLADEKVKRFVTSWKSKFQGRHKSHKVAVLHGGDWKVEKTSESMREMQFEKQRRMMRDDILATFKVPKTVIGMTEDVNRANAEATTRAFVERVVVPRMRKLTTHLNEFYLREWVQDGSKFFDFEDPTPEDVTTKLKVYKSGLGGDGSIPWMTINEVRQKENLEPVDGGDNIYLPVNVVPAGGTSNDGKAKGFITLKGKKLKPKAHKFMMPIPPAKLGELRKKALSKKIKLDLYKLVSRVVEYKNVKVKKEKKSEAFWKQMIAKTDVLEQSMIEKLWRLFTAQEKITLQGLDHIKSLSKLVRKARDPNDILFDLDEEAEVWFREFEPFITRIIKDRGREILDYLGISGELDLSQQRVIDYLRTEGLKFVSQVNENTREALRKTLGIGITQEEGIGELRKRVVDVFSKARGVRSLMIARTEVLRATNYGTLEGYRQSGVVKRKIWYTALDERVCPICQPMHGKEVKVAGKFKPEGDGSFGKVQAPPAHVNCRCTIIAGILGDE